VDHVPASTPSPSLWQIRSNLRKEVDDGKSPLFVRYNADEQFTFLFGILCGLAYFIFKLIRIWQQEDTVYSNLSLSLTVFDALSIISLAACGIWGIWVGSGFGQGLKQASAFSRHCRKAGTDVQSPLLEESQGFGGPNRRKRMWR
jgi:hypothetical protein